MAKGAGKPKLSPVKATEPPAAKFDLGTRPTSLRGKPPGSPPKALPNTRDYGKTQSTTQPAPPAAIQPGAPMPQMDGMMSRGGKVGW